jgi:biopolymer transport protein ExbD
MRLRQPETRRREPDLTGLINIVFLILIFFLVAGTLRSFADRDIKLAKAHAVEPGPVAPGRLVLFADERIAYRGKDISVNEIAERLRSDERLDKTVPFMIVADGRLPAHRALAVIEAVKAGGIRDVTMLTERQERP